MDVTDRMNVLRLLSALLLASVAVAGEESPYLVARAAAPIGIDASGTDPAWSRARPVARFTAPWRERSDRHLNHTRARLLWDDEYLYFLAEMEDEEIVVASPRDDDPLWFGDVFELFFKPSVETPSYYEFEVNPANARLDIYLPRRARDAYQRWRSARRFDWRTAARETALGWIAEGRIPWSDFAPSGGRPKAGDVWRFALCRYDYRIYREPVLSTSAPLTRPDFHRWEEWAEMRFGGD